MAGTLDYLKLHFIVFLWGFTAILGMLISVPPVEMVFLRTLIAAAGMGLVVYFTKGMFKLSNPDYLKVILTGFIVAAHWIAFFYSARISNVSVSLVGFATGSFWTALLEPLCTGKKISPLEIGLGIIVVVGLYIIFFFDFRYPLGLTVGVLSGLSGSVFSIINSKLVKRIPSITITFYEMLGATLATALFFPFYKTFTSTNGTLHLNPTLLDWFYLGILALVCSVYAYTAVIELMKKLSTFFIQLTMTLEPIYGIVMAVIVFGDREKMNTQFYTGTAVITGAVLLYPLLKKKQPQDHTGYKIPDQ
jgi:drug/metabolite transporter (DMT)-like permease